MKEEEVEGENDDDGRYETELYVACALLWEQRVHSS